MSEHPWLYVAMAIVAAVEATAFVHRYRVARRHELLQDSVEILVALLQPKRLVAIESDLSERKAEAKALRVDVDRHDRELREVRERVQRLSNPEVA